MSKKKKGYSHKSQKVYTKTYYCEDTNETCVGYDNYLKTRHWKQLRKQLVPKDHKCTVCGKSNKAIHLHHITYERVGHELPTDLIPLCEKCHNYIHNKGYADGFTGTKQEIIYLRQQMGITYTENRNTSTHKCESCQGCIWYYKRLLKKRNGKSYHRPFCFKYKQYNTVRCPQFSIYAKYDDADSGWVGIDDFLSECKHYLPKKKKKT